MIVQRTNRLESSNRFTTASRAQGSPQTKRTLSAVIVALKNHACVCVTSFNRIGDEFYRSIAHRHMSTALVTTAGRHNSP